MIRASGVFVAVVALGAAVSAERQDSTQDPASVKEVMTSMTIPASDAVFDAASSPPDTDAKWAALRRGADTLAASGRLLASPRLARDATTWMDMARALVTQAEAVLQVADARARDRLEQASDQVYQTCETCHEKYLQP
jgi:cytochrome c556